MERDSQLKANIEIKHFAILSERDEDLREMDQTSLLKVILNV